MQITSLQNARIKDLAKFRNRRHRDRCRKILIEGYRGILRALDNGMAMEELYVCRDLFIGENEDALIQRIADCGAQVFETTPEVFRKVTYRDRPEGLLAIAPQFHLAPADLPHPKPGLFVVGEAIEKPGNLGTMLRSADASGCNGFIVCDACTDMFNPNVVCASVGTLFTVPTAEASSEDCIKWCRAGGVKIVAATPAATEIYSEVDLTQSIAVVMGTEQYGLSKQWIEDADICVRIPMHGKADSLNVATATTLLLFEAVRQRRAAGIEPWASGSVPT